MNDEMRGPATPDRHDEPTADVPDESTADAPDEWDRMVAAFRTAAPRGSAPAWLEQRVMAEIEAMPERGSLARVLEWLLRPAPIRVSPMMGGLVLAAFAAVIALPSRGPGPEVVPPTGGGEAIVYVQFVLDAPGANAVAVAGDFSEWEPTFELQDADGDGVWTGRVPVEPGVHTYMFLIDGNEWQTDPRADRYQDDGFGNRNAVLAVANGV